MTDRRYDPNVTRSVQDPDVVAPQATVPRFDSRPRLLLEGPIVGTLLRLATPNVLVMFVQAAVGLIETYFVAKLGTDALAGVALVFPVLMLMQMMSAGAVGGGISSAIARALRSEEHTSELQSPCNLVCRLLLEKKKRKSSKNSSITAVGSSLRSKLTYSYIC